MKKVMKLDPDTGCNVKFVVLFINHLLNPIVMVNFYVGYGNVRINVDYQRNNLPLQVILKIQVQKNLEIFRGVVAPLFYSQSATRGACSLVLYLLSLSKYNTIYIVYI